MAKHARGSVRTAGARVLYEALAELGEQYYSEALCLCDSEREAAAWATATLVRSLEQKRLLQRLSRR